jgi:hypothetical protein
MNLKIPICAGLVVAHCLVGCGGSGSGSASGSGQKQYPSTAAIQSNMEQNYTNEESSVSSSIQACFRQNGESGAALVCSADAKQAVVLNFLNTVVANIATVRASESIDNTAIATLLANYQSEDIDWLNESTFAPTFTMTAAQVSALALDYGASVNASYSNALLQFSAITNDAIQSNLEQNYTYEQSVVADAVQACFRADGLSGKSLVCGVNDKQAAVQTFLNTIIANLKTVSGTASLDTVSIGTMLATYQSEDIGWLNANTFAPTFTMTAAQVSALSPGYNVGVNTSYSNALLQLNAL